MVKKIWIFSSKNEKFQNLIQHPFSRWVQFCEIQRLQGAVKNFLGVEDICSGYLEGPPWSGLSNAPTFMIIWWVYQKILRNFEFLVKKTFRDTFLDLTFLSNLLKWCCFSKSSSNLEMDSYPWCFRGVNRKRVMRHWSFINFAKNQVY